MNYDIFCRVIDNYGDAGVCLRLGRELALMGHTVHLYCSSLETIRTIQNKEDATLNNLKIIPWDENLYKSYQAGTVIILSFSCRVDEKLVSIIERSSRLIINLEYLTAENTAKDFNYLPSPVYKIPCYFFFPGFVAGTGGLNFEQSFIKRIKEFQKKKTSTAELSLTLFSYHNQALEKILKELISYHLPCSMTVFAGTSLDNLNGLLNLNLKEGDIYQEGSLRITANSMISQGAYNDLILKSDLNLVRGEDSISQAVLSGNPFLWQIYPQKDNADIKKLNAFLDVMEKFVTEDEGQNFKLYKEILHAYNQNNSYEDEIIEPTIALKKLFRRFSISLITQKSLSCNLHNFCRELIT